MLSTVLSKHSLSNNYYYLQHNRKSSYPKAFIWPLRPRPPLQFSTSRTLTASDAGVPGGQGPGLNPSCRRALSWVKCPASFMSGLAPPHSASTSSRIAMVTASSLTGREGLELRSRCQILSPPHNSAQIWGEAGGLLSQVVSHSPPSTPVPFCYGPHLCQESERGPLLSCRPPQRPQLSAWASPEASTTAVSGGGTGRQPPPTKGPGPQGTKGDNSAVGLYRGTGRARKSGNPARA